MAGRTDNTVRIEAPMDLVWKMTNDVESWPELFTEYASAEILERRGDTVRFRLTMHPDENGEAHTWVSERTPDEANRVAHAKRIETGPFRYMNLRWEYREVDGGVELRWVQDFEMRPEAPVDDAGAERILNERTATEMQHIKEVVERAAGTGAG